MPSAAIRLSSLIVKAPPSQLEIDRARKAVSYESLRDIAAAHGARPDAWDLLAERMTNANITGAYQRAFAGRTPLLWLARIGGFLLAAVSIGVAIQTVYVCFATHNYLPQDDEWRNLDIFRSIVNNGQIIKNLFGQHNEHRIFFPRLVMFSDYLFFDGRNILNLIVIFAIQTLEAILFLVLLWRSRPSAEGAVAVGAMIVMLLFSMRQSENFVWGFQVQFVGVFACASLAIVLFVMSLSARSQGRSFALMSAAYALTAISTFSMANGLMSGVALIIIAVLARARARTIILTTALTVILGGLFLFDYQFGDSHAIVGAVRRPFQVLTFTAAYLGNFLIFDVDHALFFENKRNIRTELQYALWARHAVTILTKLARRPFAAPDVSSGSRPSSRTDRDPELNRKYDEYLPPYFVEEVFSKSLGNGNARTRRN